MDNMKIIEIKGKIKVVTGLHIGAGNDSVHIGGVDNSVVKTHDGYPYIPGSSLKGKIRSLLELSEGATNGRPSDTNAFPNSLIPIVFGDTTENSGITRVIFRDAMLSEESKNEILEKNILPTEEKSENTIDRLSGVAQNPRNTERVIPGLFFDFELNVRVLNSDNEDNFKNLINKGLWLLEKDALGGSGSRGYGKVQFLDLSWDGKEFSLGKNGIL